MKKLTAFKFTTKSGEKVYKVYRCRSSARRYFLTHGYERGDVLIRGYYCTLWISYRPDCVKSKRRAV